MTRVSEGNVSIVKAAIFMNLIFDAIDRCRAETGVVITPENIAQYADERRKIRDANNAALGVKS